MTRESPFDPPSELLTIQDREGVTRVSLWDGSTPWLITGYDNVRTVLSDQRFSADTDLPGYPHNSAGSAARRAYRKASFLNMDNPRHDQLRRMVTQDFMIKRIESRRARIQQIVDGLIDEMLTGPNPVDLVEAFSLPLPSMLICEMLGVEYDERALFHRLSRVTISAKSTPQEAVGALEEMLDLMYRTIDSKLAHPTDDIVSRLVHKELLPGHLTRDELASVCQLMLVGGHETTSNMIALGTLTLFQNPEAFEEIRWTTDSAVIANTVEELLRFLTIFHMGRRRVALEDVTVSGRDIRAGEGVIIAHDAADRDPSAFPDPDVLDIHRQARHHLAFGYGGHQCLGQPLARVELQVVFGTLYRRIPSLGLAVDVNEIRFKHDSVVYGVMELPVRW